MGQDKGLLPHPHAGSWLEYTLELLDELRTPITLSTGHTSHLPTAVALAKRHGWLERLEPLLEAPPRGTAAGPGQTDAPSPRSDHAAVSGGHALAGSRQPQDVAGVDDHSD